jgi:hypothetical protein
MSTAHLSRWVADGVGMLIIVHACIVSVYMQSLQIVIHRSFVCPRLGTCNNCYMNITLPAAFVDRLSDLSPGATKTYLSLLWLKSTRTPHPTQPDIAKHINASARSVATYLHELETAGYIEKKRIGSGRRTDYALVTELAYGVQ